MKRVVIITGCLLVLLHAFVAWILISYPAPDPWPTIRLWEQGYVEVGFPDWHLPAIAERTLFLWSPFWVSSSFGEAHLPLGLRLFISSAGWLAFVLAVYCLIRFIRRRLNAKVVP
jgi:hypothetical protein